MWEGRRLELGGRVPKCWVQGVYGSHEHGRVGNGAYGAYGRAMGCILHHLTMRPTQSGTGVGQIQ